MCEADFSMVDYPMDYYEVHHGSFHFDDRLYLLTGVHRQGAKSNGRAKMKNGGRGRRTRTVQKNNVPQELRYSIVLVVSLLSLLSYSN